MIDPTRILRDLLLHPATEVHQSSGQLRLAHVELSTFFLVLPSTSAPKPDLDVETASAMVQRVRQIVG